MKLMLQKSAASSLALAGLVMVLPGLCLAQDSGQPQTLRVNTYRIKPEMVPEWESLLKNEVTPGYKKAGIPFLSVWETASFGEGNEYVAASPIAKFADLDGPNPLSKALAPDILASLLTRARKCLLESRSAAVISHPELSIMHEMQEPPAFAMVTTSHVAPGHSLDFQNFLKNDIVPAYRKAEVQQYWVYETVFGSDMNEWTTLLLYKKYADLDGGPLLARTLGQEGYQKVLAKTSGIISSSRRNLIKYRPDLSIGE